MTEKSRRTLTILTASVFLVFLVALVAAGAYVVGRNSTSPSGPSPALELDADPDISTDRDSVTESECSVGKLPAPTNQGNNVESEGSATSSETQDASSGDADSEHQSQTGVNQESDATPRIPVDLENVDLELMLEVWEIINENFDGVLPSSADVTYGAVVGSMELLEDRFTRFIPPEIAQRSRIQIQGGYEGIGAFVDLNEEGYLLILRAIDGLPADKAGVLSDDIVTHVDGQSISGMSLTQIVSLVTGPEGTEVTLTIRRDNADETLDLTIVRERIEFPVVIHEILEENIGYVRLTAFSNGADLQLSEAIDELMAQEPDGLILDLRDNPGGLLAQAIQVSDLFLPEGIVAFQRDSQGLERVFESEDGDQAEIIPLVVLVNRGSASASEIVAGAIRDLGRGILIGEQTLGKGSVQQSYTLSDGSELRVTIARWYTPNNESIDSQGILPDIEIETPADLGGGGDEQLQRAIQVLLGGE
jgi:carboxyl-terminal processing protease